MNNILTLENLVTGSYDKTISSPPTYVGIDFGTSTTVVSYSFYDNETNKIKTETMTLNQKDSDGTIIKSDIVPSVIACVNNKLIIGEGAAELKYEMIKDQNIWYSFKMELGEDVGSKYVNSCLGKSKGIQILNAKDATNIFFKYLKAKIEEFLCAHNLNDTNVNYAVSIPASFEANQREDLVDALMFNEMDISKQSLIDEPNAAFLSYIEEAEAEGHPFVIPDKIKPKILVFDFGAGTCDISILEIGCDYKGIYSENLSISKFEKLGGDDIDKFITYEYLLPKLFETNHVAADSFIISEKRVIANKLLKTAENLKITLCKQADLLKGTNEDLSDIDFAQYDATVNDLVEINTSHGILRMDNESLSMDDFKNAMDVFTRNSSHPRSFDGHSGNEYNSIFNPIKSALLKANLKTTDVDYILFIGGSSRNPFIRAAVRKLMPESKLIVPRNPQIHVSRGAAIHSFIFNYFNQSIIKPITSEPICVIVKDDKLLSLIPAGTSIPTGIITFDNLQIQREGQTVVELPICISNKNKILKNLVIKSPNSSGFNIGTKIELSLELTADKLLQANAIIGNQVCFVDAINPFANRELTNNERKAMQAEKDSYNEAADNNGTPSKECLIRLGNAYKKAEMYFKAAETFVRCNQLYPNAVNPSIIGNMYANAGMKGKDLEYSELAYRINKNSITAFNLAYRFMYEDEDKFLHYINESLSMDPNKPHSLFVLGSYECENGNQEGLAKIRKAFEIWKQDYDSGKLSEVDYTWLPSAARYLGEFDLANEIVNKRNSLSDQDFYNSDNTAKVKKDN